MLFSRYKVAYEKKRKIMRNVASVAELTKSFFAEIDKVENRKDLEKLRVRYLGREKGFSRQFCVRLAVGKRALEMIRRIAPRVFETGELCVNCWPDICAQSAIAKRSGRSKIMA